VLSYDSSMEWSMRNLNPDEWQLPCCINSCIHLHNPLLSPAAHSRDCETCIWYVIQIEENEPDKEWRESEAIYIWNKWIEFYDINCQLKALKRISLRSFIVQVTHIVVTDELRGLEAFGSKWLYIETLCWLSTITVWILRTILKRPLTVSMSLRWVSM